MAFDHHLNYTTLFLPSLLFIPFRYLIAFTEIENIDSDGVSCALAVSGVLVADLKSLIPKAVFDYQRKRPHRMVKWLPTNQQICPVPCC